MNAVLVRDLVDEAIEKSVFSNTVTVCSTRKKRDVRNNERYRDAFLKLMTFVRDGKPDMVRQLFAFRRRYDWAAILCIKKRLTQENSFGAELKNRMDGIVAQMRRAEFAGAVEDLCVYDLEFHATLAEEAGMHSWPTFVREWKIDEGFQSLVKFLATETRNGVRVSENHDALMNGILDPNTPTEILEQLVESHTMTGEWQKTLLQRAQQHANPDGNVRCLEQRYDVGRKKMEEKIMDDLLKSYRQRIEDVHGCLPEHLWDDVQSKVASLLNDVTSIPIHVVDATVERAIWSDRSGKNATIALEWSKFKDLNDRDRLKAEVVGVANSNDEVLALRRKYRLTPDSRIEVLNHFQQGTAFSR
jgi:DNA-binding FadR family transcriptional regulator